MKTARYFPTRAEVVQDSIRDPRDAAAYLSEAARDEDSRVFLIALKDVITVHGSVSEVARKAGVNRANLQKALSGQKKAIQFDVLRKTLDAAGFQISIQPIRLKRTATEVDVQPRRSKRAASALGVQPKRRTRAATAK